MLNFYKDFLDGPVYIVVLVVSVILLMAIIGYVMEKKKFQKERMDSIATVDNVVDDIPLETGTENAIDEVIKETNAVTNAEIPDVLDFNQIDSDLNKEDTNSEVQIQNDEANIIQEESVVFDIPNSEEIIMNETVEKEVIEESSSLVNDNNENSSDVIVFDIPEVENNLVDVNIEQDINTSLNNNIEDEEKKEVVELTVDENNLVDVDSLPIIDNN